MDQYLPILGASLITAIMCVVVRQKDPGLGSMLSLIGCVCILIAMIQFLSPVLKLLEDLREMTGFTNAATAPLYKTVGIGILSQISSSVCEDAGEKSLAKAVELASALFALYVSTPLISSVLDIFQKSLGG